MGPYGGGNIILGTLMKTLERSIASGVSLDAGVGRVGYLRVKGGCG